MDMEDQNKIYQVSYVTLLTQSNNFYLHCIFLKDHKLLYCCQYRATIQSFWEIIKDTQNMSKDERREMLSLSNKKEKGVSQEIIDC